MDTNVKYITPQITKITLQNKVISQKVEMEGIEPSSI